MPIKKQKLLDWIKIKIKLHIVYKKFTENAETKKSVEKGITLKQYTK